MVSELRNVGGASGQVRPRYPLVTPRGDKKVTPRQSASVHLPELAELRALCVATFQAEIPILTTPDGTWGYPPDWTRWPSVNGMDIPRFSWKPPK